jgi:hypothetical protein
LFVLEKKSNDEMEDTLYHVVSGGEGFKVEGQCHESKHGEKGQDNL